jgi:16S rRNA G966 N2-methylase RsmD
METNDLSQRWLDFYRSIKDVSWPDIKSQEDFLSLPEHLIREILFDHFLIDHLYFDNQGIENVCSVKTTEWKDVRNNSEFFLDLSDLKHTAVFMANDIKVCYAPELDGGGTVYAKRYADMLSKVYKDRVFDNCYEWCSGPGFIGFEIFSRGLCNNLYFSDIFGPAMKSIETTISANKSICENKVFYKQNKAISDLPQEWKFDLVVANPPYYGLDLPTFASQLALRSSIDQRKAIDYQWKLHQEFFANITKHLSEDGVIFISHAANLSGPNTFKSMIESNGMYINNCYWENKNHPEWYYLEIKRSV